MRYAIKIGLKSPGAKMSKIVWSNIEDERLRGYVNDTPTQCRIGWTRISELMVNKSAKQCRDRWFNHVLPNSTKGKWTPLEEKKVVELQSLYGNKWTMIASFLPGRSDYDIRKKWYSISKMIWSNEEDRQLKEFIDTMPEMNAKINDRWTAVSALVVNRSAKECRDRWFSHLRPKIRKWTAQEDEKVVNLQSLYGDNWSKISSCFYGRSERAARSRYYMIKKNKIHHSHNTYANNNNIKKAAKLEPSPISKLATMEITKDEQVLRTKESINAARVVVNMKLSALEPPSIGVKNEWQNITKLQTKDTYNPNGSLSKGPNLPFVSTYHFEKHLKENSPSDNYVTNLPTFAIQDSDGEEPFDDDFADAVAYATAFINSDNKSCL